MRSIVIGAVAMAALGAGAVLPPEAQAKFEADRAKCERFASMGQIEIKTAEREVIRALQDFELVPPVVCADVRREDRRDRIDFAMSAGMTMTDGGRLYCIWHAGGDNVKSHIVGVWSDDGGRTWTDTKFTIGQAGPIAYVGMTPLYRTAIMGNIWFAPDGTLRIHVHQAINMFTSRGALFEFICRNPDDAEPKWEPARMIGWGGNHNHPIVLKNGTWLLPNNFEDFSGFGKKYDAFDDYAGWRGCGVLASTDNGQSWQMRGYVRPADPSITHYTEHSLIDMGDGRIRMYMRTGKGLMVSESADEARTWSVPVFSKAIRQIVARCGVIRLKDGRMLCVKNGLTPEFCPEPVTLGPRTNLTVFLSDDDGETWKGGLLLDERQVAYPDIFEAQDGFVYICYDHDRNRAKDELLFAKIRAEDVLAKRIVSDGAFVKHVIFSENEGRPRVTASRGN